jgi:hypothetical protein
MVCTVGGQGTIQDYGLILLLIVRVDLSCILRELSQFEPLAICRCACLVLNSCLSEIRPTFIVVAPYQHSSSHTKALPGHF